MILQIRGVNGSGKSTIVRNWMNDFDTVWEGQYTYGRKKPLYYISSDYRIAVVGHYEGADCGGGDTIGGANKVAALIHQIPHAYPSVEHIVAEGLLLSEDEKWTTQLHEICSGKVDNNSPLKGNEVRVIFIKASCKWCVNNVFKRQKAKNKRTGKDKPIEFNVPKLERRYDYIANTYHKLVRNEVPTWQAKPAMVAKLIKEWIV